MTNIYHIGITILLRLCYIVTRNMLAKVISCAIVGLEGAIVEVETDISPGLPSFTKVETVPAHYLQV